MDFLKMSQVVAAGIPPVFTGIISENLFKYSSRKLIQRFLQEFFKRLLLIFFFRNFSRNSSRDSFKYSSSKSTLHGFLLRCLQVLLQGLRFSQGIHQEISPVIPLEIPPKILPWNHPPGILLENMLRIPPGIIQQQNLYMDSSRISLP